jgi:hypothetical protein
MPQLKPETALRKKLEALDRHKAMIEALGAFVKAHSKTTHESSIHQLHGKVGLIFPDYALIVPHWKNGKVVLKLVKSGEDWINQMEADSYYQMDKTVVEDVSGMANDELESVLDRVFKEANPNWEEYEEE